MFAENKLSNKFAKNEREERVLLVSFFKVHINARDTKAARSSTPAGARTPAAARRGQAGQPEE